MSITHAQDAAVATYSGTSSVNKAFSSNCTNGSRIIARVTQEDGGGTFSCTDGANGSYGTADVDDFTGSGNTSAAAIFSKANTSTTAVTVTVTLGGSTHGALKIDEITGSAGTPVLDAVGSDQGLIDTPSVAITTVGANAALFSIGSFYPAGATVDTGFNSSFAESGISNAYHWGEHDIDVSPGAKTLSYGLGSENYFAIVAASYESNGGGGGDPEGRLKGGKLIRGGLLRGGVLAA